MGDKTSHPVIEVSLGTMNEWLHYATLHFPDGMLAENLDEFVQLALDVFPFDEVIVAGIVDDTSDVRIDFKGSNPFEAIGAEREDFEKILSGIGNCTFGSHLSFEVRT